MPKIKIGFNKPYMTGKELIYLQQAHATAKLSGDGQFTKKCQKWIETTLGAKKALLTQSCTAALEMAALLINTQAGDEIIMPSYTFVSTANAFVLRGGVPVFVDIKPNTLNINETLIETAITSKTKAIVPVHYAGVSCEMDTIMAIAQKHHLYVIEDAAQAIMASYKGKHLGSIGHLSTLSFHETKNIISGEGGALLINDEKFIENANIIWEKGTNRKQFFDGQVEKYTWVSLGSSFLPSELTSAFLWAQLEEAQTITQERKQIWEHYHQAFEILEKQGYLERPIIPADVTHNAHMYYILLNDFGTRTDMIDHLSNNGINAIFHYIPLHSSPAGKKFGCVKYTLVQTESLANRIIRMPFYIGITKKDIEYIAIQVAKFFKQKSSNQSHQQIRIASI